MHADACELASLEEAGLETCDVVIAATGDDKVNLVVSLLAKTEFAVRRVVARVNDPRNEWLFDENWGVDVAVSTPRLLAALVEEAVAVGDLVRLMTLRQGQANLVEVTLPAHTPLAGRPVRALKLPARLGAGDDPARRPGDRAAGRRRAGGGRRAAVRRDVRRSRRRSAPRWATERGEPPSTADCVGGRRQAAGSGARRARRTAQIVPSSATPTSG